MIAEADINDIFVFNEVNDEDIKDKGISIEENPIDFLRNQIV